MNPVEKFDLYSGVPPGNLQDQQGPLQSLRELAEISDFRLNRSEILAVSPGNSAQKFRPEQIRGWQNCTKPRIAEIKINHFTVGKSERKKVRSALKFFRSFDPENGVYIHAHILLNAP